jgi:molybdenum cofactor synthesis domain-containing protein
MDVAIVTVGDELLAGDTENTNQTWLGRQLADRGVTVTRMLTVPDDLDAIAENVRRYSGAFDAVVVTGGLGGTPDDITMDGVAAAFDRPLEPDELAREDLERTLAAIAESRPDLDLDVDVEAEASIPTGARPLINDAGLSPGCVVEDVYVLPGIPSEMKSMFEGVAEEFAGDVETETFHTEEPEANLIERLDEARERFDVVVGCYPDRDAGHNRLKVSGEDGAAVGEATAWLRERVEIADSVGR